MITKEDFPKLGYLLECYYPQTWQEVSGPEWSDPVRDLIATEERQALVEVKADIERFLSCEFSAHEMDAFLHLFAIGAMGENFRELLVSIRDMLDAALERSLYRG